MAQKNHLAALAVLVFTFCACGFGQTNASSGAQAASRPAKPSPAVPAAPAIAPASLLGRPAQPAKVTLVSGQLTVKADNSSLAEILNQISKAGGMKVDGLDTAGNAGQRIFGNYGPGTPRDVLSELLSGCGYNVMMLGDTAAGTPRELTLMAEAAGGVPNPPPPPAGDQNQGNDGAYQPQYVEQDPSNQPPPSSRVRNGIRTPEEMLQELQRMRQRRQQPQPQPQQN